MKKYTSLFAFLLVAFLQHSFAQAPSPKQLAASIPQIESRDRLIFEIMHDNWLDKPDSVKMKWYNRGFNTYFFYDIALTPNKTISLAPGLGFSCTNVYTRSILTANDTMSYFIPINDSINYSRNKITTTSVDIPIELRFRTKPNEQGKSFKIAVGARIGYFLNVMSKYKGDDYLFGTDNEIFIKNKRLPNVNRIKLGSTFRIGYGNYNLIAYYSIGTLFNRDKGPEIHPFSIGFSFNGF